jgi:hypothetical protein
MARYKGVDSIFRNFNTHENKHKIWSTYCVECGDVIHLWTNTEDQEEHSKVRGMCKEHICTSGRIITWQKEMDEYYNKYMELKPVYLKLREDSERLEKEAEKLTKERWEVHSRLQNYKSGYFSARKALGLKEKK